MTEPKFNLIDEAWIPVADVGLVSLRNVFSRTDLRAFGGTALQKIALYKLLLAIAQAAHTPQNDEAWIDIGAHGLAAKVLTYLDTWHDSFWLYGERPFLQMPAVKKAETQEYSAIMPEVASGNTTVLTQWQQLPSLSHADKALLLIINMSCCFGGKKTDKKVILSAGHSKSSAKSGPALCSGGLLHNFLTGTSLQETIWLNVHTFTSIENNKVFTSGLGKAPWEEMPQGEICPTAERLKKSFMGRLVPMARFCLLEEESLRYVEGIQHPDYQEGFFDPSASIMETGKKNRMLWTDPGKRPWRSLTSLLSFIKDQNANDAFTCPNLHKGITRLRTLTDKEFGIWSGGVRVSSNAGEQYLSGDDDMVESELLLSTKVIHEMWFVRLQSAMTTIDTLAKNLYGSVMGYYKNFQVAPNDAKKFAESATQLYWQLAEQHFQNLLNACDEEDSTERHNIIHRMAKASETAFALTCPQDTARQIQAWAQCRPKFRKILSAS